MEEFCIASFRSRTYVLRFEAVLQQAGIACRVISTPRQVALGCGLSVSFAPSALSSVKALSVQLPTASLLGFYLVRRQQGRLQVHPI